MRRAAVFLSLAAATVLARANNPADLSSVLPSFHPGTEIVSWNGKSWDITNNRIFESRFERYLSTPSDTNQDTTEHFKVLSAIRQLLTPLNHSPQARDEAFRLLKKASDYKADDLLSDAIANQVYSAWLAQKNIGMLRSATQTLENERKRLEWNLRVAAEAKGLKPPPAEGNPAEHDPAHTIEMQQIAARLAEVNLLLKSNLIKTEISQAQAKTEFQVLIVQLFLQRRFHHVLIATRFYRAIYADGSSQQLKLGDEATSLLARSTGGTPTLTSLDSLCGEIIGNAHDGVNAFRTLLANNEMESATKRLSEAFLIGEYLTPLDVVSLPEKHRALVFVQKSKQLHNALEVKDYVLAEKLVNDLAVSAKDFDTSKANSAIQTAKATSAMHLARARNAAISGDNSTQETALNAAAEIWPTNPALAEVAAGIYKDGNVHARALAEFDQLISHRNWRQIYEDRMRFIPAVATHPEKQARLQQILDKIMMVDRTIARASEQEKSGDVTGAWETTDILFRHIPEEYPRLSRMHADLAPRAADYVKAIRTAEELEQKGERGSSLFWYLQAQAIYPQGEIAKAGLQRLNHLILPDSW